MTILSCMCCCSSLLLFSLLPLYSKASASFEDFCLAHLFEFDSNGDGSIQKVEYDNFVRAGLIKFEYSGIYKSVIDESFFQFACQSYPNANVECGNHHNTNFPLLLNDMDLSLFCTNLIQILEWNTNGGFSSSAANSRKVTSSLRGRDKSSHPRKFKNHPMEHSAHTLQVESSLSSTTSGTHHVASRNIRGPSSSSSSHGSQPATPSLSLLLFGIPATTATVSSPTTTAVTTTTVTSRRVSELDDQGLSTYVIALLGVGGAFLFAIVYCIAFHYNPGKLQPARPCVGTRTKVRPLPKDQTNNTNNSINTKTAKDCNGDNNNSNDDNNDDMDPPKFDMLDENVHNTTATTHYEPNGSEGTQSNHTASKRSQYGESDDDTDDDSGYDDSDDSTEKKMRKPAVLATQSRLDQNQYASSRGNPPFYYGMYTHKPTNGIWV